MVGSEGDQVGSMQSGYACEPNCAVVSLATMAQGRSAVTTFIACSSTDRFCDT
ncbi:MAG TPA: hypothetical protein VGT61_13425 [Thermomicrobiales bacterium]|nr:hypothetical protein [Thermomicrobiales bacterium]